MGSALPEFFLRESQRFFRVSGSLREYFCPPPSLKSPLVCLGAAGGPASFCLLARPPPKVTTPLLDFDARGVLEPRPTLGWEHGPLA
jgi:hypothetical protein